MTRLVDGSRAFLGRALWKGQDELMDLDGIAGDVASGNSGEMPCDRMASANGPGS